MLLLLLLLWTAVDLPLQWAATARRLVKAELTRAEFLMDPDSSADPQPPLSPMSAAEDTAEEPRVSLTDDGARAAEASSNRERVDEGQLVEREDDHLERSPRDELAEQEKRVEASPSSARSSTAPSHLRYFSLT